MITCTQRSAFYISLFVLLISMMFFPSKSLIAATLHTIIVADTLDGGIGADVDEAKIQKLEKKIRDATCLALNPHVIDGGSVKRGGGGHDKVKETLTGLSVGPDDVVIFYYSGHGTNTGTGSIWPSLGVEGQSTPRSKLIDLEWVKTTLEQKNPRLFIAIADACNVFLPGDGSRTRREMEKPDAYKKLFLDYSGSIVASSSIPDQYSHGDPQQGGYFTRAFLASLNKSLGSSNPNWDDIMNVAIKSIPTGSSEQPQQQPQAEVRVTKRRNGRRDPDPDWCEQPPPPVPTPVIPYRVKPKKGTCAKADYHWKNGQKCCWDRRGTERCFR